MESAEGKMVTFEEMGSTSFPNREDGKRNKMVTQVTSWMLPQDLTSDILSRVPVKSVMRCRCVCKAWRGLLKSPYFINMHFDRSSQAENPSLILATIYMTKDPKISISFPRMTHVEIDYKVHLIEHMLELGVVDQPIVPLQSCDYYQVHASCSGLLCLSRFAGNGDDILICNPFTQETVELPRFNNPYKVCNLICGFGYHPGTKEYKVLSVVYERLSEDYSKTTVEVFTLGSSTWRSKGEAPFELMGEQFNVLVNGAIHWLSHYPVELNNPAFIIADEDVEPYNVAITAFDIGNEEFRVLPIPPQARLVAEWQYKEVQELGGSLSFVDFFSRDRVDVWVMKHYGVEESWSKQFVVPIHELVEKVSLLGHMAGGEILLVYNGDKFISYDPNDDQIRHLPVQVPDDRASPDTRITDSFVIVHVGSLVSPRVGV